MPSCSPGGCTKRSKERIRSSYATRELWSSKKPHTRGTDRGHEAFLEEKEIEELNIAGVDSEGAVLATMFSLIDAGYQVKILECLVSPTTAGIGKP